MFQSVIPTLCRVGQHSLRAFSPRAFALSAALILATSLPAQADLAITDDLSAYGDIRAGYFHLRRNDRNDSTYTDSDWRLRLRAGLKWQPDERWTFAARFAGRFANDQDGLRFTMDPYNSGSSGLDLGESTLDELYMDYQPGNSSFRLGRFQASHNLRGIAPKSLDRNDSNNIEITWTDGLSWTHKLDNGWQTRVIVDHNHRRGPSNIRRAPLGFDDGDSRWSGFATIENDQPRGAFVQRGLSVSWLPDALYTDGLIVNRQQDYWALTARTALRWPIGDTGSAFQLGLEGGYAPDTPRNTALGLPGSGDSDGTAWQVALNWLDFAPGHGLALVTGRAEAGWLLSPDFTPNQDLLEVRYQWKVDAIQSIEIRLRQRTDLDRPITADKRREDVDFYLRYTVRF